MNLTFSGREVRDLLVAWVVLGVAFAVFFAGGDPISLLQEGPVSALAVSLLTAGVGFLLHELGHKVVAVHYGQVAEFRADYSMLVLALLSAFLGFIFAAPGAVHHRGMLTERQHGLIALAGPAVNVVLALLFIPLALVVPVGGFLASVANLGVIINLFLAAFNMIPFGPLDGRKVLAWSKVVYAVFTVPTVGVTVLLILG
ncbi:Zn-dependent protease [Haloprofundus marisrubri]|uniref:Zn-dependent protease n=1 Tax=Haloprofundus marisrubri TaxID=1514971 RepID=A0A0W1RBT6_9EURY|nr:Zn-dependent protease [Haloprofundus marisrubri]KTG11162.1 Zn-dependent protease [Haloprofundus marisrubri]